VVAKGRPDDVGFAFGFGTPCSLAGAVLVLVVAG